MLAMNLLKPFPRQLMVSYLLAFTLVNALAVTAIKPERDEQVIETLPAARPFNRSAAARPAASGPTASVPVTVSAAEALSQAQAWVGEARQSGDTRFWGRAQAILSPWWDKPDAPPALMVMQATVQQGRHEFAAAHATLKAALKRDRGNAQAWLTLASLERLSGRYKESLLACEAVALARQLWYAKVCSLETESLQGQTAQTPRDFQTLLSAAQTPSQIAWISSLLAESEERAGNDVAAVKAYQRSLKAEPDLYTALAYSDMLLRTRQPQTALKALAALPETDAVLIRRARALRLSGQSGWQAITTELYERDAALRRRGDDVSLHAREAGLIALWLDDQPSAALALARQNLKLQREPIDWWLALQSAQAVKDDKAVAEFQAGIAAIGLKDQRLQALPLRGKP
jgi:tetratricopeptide (TPR) repeat protein